MTVSYSAQVATSSVGCFIQLLPRWRGSIYKFIWRDFAIFAVLYYCVFVVYYAIMNDAWKRWFEEVAEFCNESNTRIPVAFILGFYVSLVVGRFWEQLNSLPWPHRVAVFVSSMIHGRDETGRMLRRTITRYLTITYILTMRTICPPIRKRFPTFEHIYEAGLMRKDEQKLLKVISQPNRKYSIHSPEFKNISLDEVVATDETQQQEDDETGPNVYYVPLLWSIDLVNQAHTEKRIWDAQALNTLIQEINNYRGTCATLFNFDWITVPLVYTQVVTIAVYTFFGTCLLSRQHLEKFVGDFYLPVFTFLEFLFIMGWLKVAECLLNPFGGDDDDFEINPLLETNLQDAFTMVDELCDFSPPLEPDCFCDSIDIDIRYTPESEEYQVSHLMGSAIRQSRKAKSLFQRICGSADDNRSSKGQKTAGTQQEMTGMLPRDTQTSAISHGETAP